jgi:hypothetical protein
MNVGRYLRGEDRHVGTCRITKEKKMVTKEQISQLRSKAMFHQNEVEKFRSAITALQSICEHDWKYDGHGHNDDCYVCTVCGLTEWR